MVAPAFVVAPVKFSAEVAVMAAAAVLLLLDKVPPLMAAVAPGVPAGSPVSPGDPAVVASVALCASEAVVPTGPLVAPDVPAAGVPAGPPG